MTFELLDFAHWLWAALMAAGAWSYRCLLGRLGQSEDRLREVELIQQKTSTENRALFKRLDELRDSIHDLAAKLDRFMGR